LNFGAVAGYALHESCVLLAPKCVSVVLPATVNSLAAIDDDEPVAALQNGLDSTHYKMKWKVLVEENYADHMIQLDCRDTFVVVQATLVVPVSSNPYVAACV
jgi:hypothetical protein